MFSSATFIGLKKAFAFFCSSLQKLPFTIPELVHASPCRSSDGVLYVGKSTFLRIPFFKVDIKKAHCSETISCLFFEKARRFKKRIFLLNFEQNDWLKQNPVGNGMFQVNNKTLDKCLVLLQVQNDI